MQQQQQPEFVRFYVKTTPTDLIKLRETKHLYDPEKRAWYYGRRRENIFKPSFHTSPFEVVEVVGVSPDVGWELEAIVNKHLAVVKPDVEETVPADGKRLCLHCGKGLRAIGDRRKNGKLFLTDWDKRKYHKSCLKIVDLREQHAQLHRVYSADF